MKVQLPKQLLSIIKTFKDANFEIYIVGGAVRDILTGKNVYDWDLTTNATPQLILSLFPNSYYNNDFGMVGIPNEIEGERPYEITTFRTEVGYTDFRRPDKVEWGKTLDEDLQRRDFTVNAMALAIEEGGVGEEVEVELIDPYKGQEDLKEKLIKAVGNPDERFREDALRMIRAVRIAAETGFKIEKNTLSAIKKNIALINKIANERIRDEFLKILASPHPYEGVVSLHEVGLLSIIIPEFEKGFEIDQASPGRHHKYDVATHSLMSLKFTPSTDPITRLATLIHDIGKPATYKKLDSGVVTFYNHEVISAKIARELADRLRFSNKEKDKLVRLVRWHQFSVDDNQTDSAIRRFIKKVGIENIQDMLDLRVGDRLGGGVPETSWRTEGFKKRLIEVQKQPFTVHDLKITGYDVMKTLKLKPGPKVGEILLQLFKEVEGRKIENEKKTLLERVKGLKKI